MRTALRGGHGGRQALRKRRFYTPRGRAKHVGVFESNLHLVKTDVIPVAIVEHFFRQQPDLLAKAHITNALTVRGLSCCNVRTTAPLGG